MSWWNQGDNYPSPLRYLSQCVLADSGASMEQEIPWGEEGSTVEGGTLSTSLFTFDSRTVTLDFTNLFLCLPPIS